MKILATVDLTQVPFSYHQSFLVMSVEHKRLLLRDVRGGDLDPGKLFELQLPESNDYQITASESLLTISRANMPLLEVVFEDSQTIRMRCRGYLSEPEVPLRLEALAKPYNTMIQQDLNTWAFTSYYKEVKLRFQRLSATAQGAQPSVTAKWQDTRHEPIAVHLLPGDEWMVQSYTVSAPKRAHSSLNFDKLARLNQSAFEAWWHGLCPKQLEEPAPAESTQPPSMPGASMPGAFMPGASMPGAFMPGASMHGASRRAAHALWQNFVPKSGLLKYPALYMTKNWMTNIWSWDNCFSALGLIGHAPERAIEQLLMFKDLQSPEGALPDFANDRYASFSSLKPPITGFTLSQLEAISPKLKGMNKRAKRQLYQMVEGQTRFWLTCQQTPLGLPYYSHGNDSGWDNGTFYSEGVPIIAPDLATFLILQIDYLIAHAEDASTANPQGHIAYWQHEQSRLLSLLFSLLWDGRQFGAIKWPEGWRIAPPTKPQTLQALMPLLLGERLPCSVREILLADLKTFEGPFGFATEALDSPHYKYNGYWRGPIWAPSTYLLVAALEACGQSQWAKSVAHKYLHLVAKSGLSENFDPLTGEGLVDTGFAWTAAVYVNFLNQYGTCTHWDTD